MKIIKPFSISVLNYLLIPFAFLFYRLDWICQFLIIIFVGILVFVNHKLSENFYFNLLYQGNLAISAVLSVDISTKLYFENVQNNLTSLVVGELFRYLAIAVTMVPILISCVIKLQEYKKRK